MQPSMSIATHACTSQLLCVTLTDAPPNCALSVDGGKLERTVSDGRHAST